MPSSLAPAPATLVAERVRERLRAEHADPARDPEFAAGLESGYQEFRIGVERYAMAVGLTLAIDLRPEGARTA